MTLALFSPLYTINRDVLLYQKIQTPFTSRFWGRALLSGLLNFWDFPQNIYDELEAIVGCERVVSSRDEPRPV